MGRIRVRRKTGSGLINRISILNFKVIKNIDELALDRFHVLVGPNASGKTTFLDALDFVKDCLVSGPSQAVENRVPQFRDLTFNRKGGAIEIHIWLDAASITKAHDTGALHYQLTLDEDAEKGVRVSKEELRHERDERIGHNTRRPRGARFLGKSSTGRDFFKREDGNYQDSFTFGQDKLTLAMTPQDEQRYPTANAVRRFLMGGVRYIQLNSRAMRQPCLATRSSELELDGTNLARVVGRMRGKPGKRPGKDLFVRTETMQRWTGHLKYALEDLADIGWARREPDNAEYIVLKYDDGFECPSWLVSDGTLRMLALTLPAFLPPNPGIYMVEEPENGVHPKALEIIVRSLSAIPTAQVLVATHSPLVVQQVGHKKLLCFKRDENGTAIEHGPDHPKLKNWEGTPDLATIFSAGVLG